MGKPASLGNVLCIGSGRLDNRNQLQDRLCMGQEDLSDSQLVAHAYEHWGTACPSHLEGEFAFVIYDQAARRVFAARDVMGIKTLYFTTLGPFMALATQSRLLHAVHEQPLAVSRKAILAWLYDEYPEDIPMFESLESVPRAASLEAWGSGRHLQKYWDFNQVKKLRYRDQDEYFQHFRELFQQAVTNRCKYQTGPIGTMLSGGLDSSSVAAVATACTGLDPQDIHPFSFRFRTLQDCDESKLSQVMAKHLGTGINWVDCERFWLFQGAFSDRTQRENPFQCWDNMDHSILKTLAGRGGRLLLTGHGGDSLMTGPSLNLCLGTAFSRAPMGSRQPFRDHLKKQKLSFFKGVYRYAVKPNIARYLRDVWKASISGPQRPPWVMPSAHGEFLEQVAAKPRERAPFRDPDRCFTYRLIGSKSAGVRRVIHWYQQIAQPYGIEVSHPFFDRRLAAFMLAIPQSMIRLGNRPKGFLRAAMTPRLPLAIVENFHKPTLYSFYHFGISKEGNNIKRLMKNSKLADMGIIDNESLLRSVEFYLKSKPGNVLASFWSTIFTELWLRNEFET